MSFILAKCGGKVIALVNGVENKVDSWSKMAQEGLLIILKK